MGDVAQIEKAGPVGVVVDVEADQSPTLGRLALALAKAQRAIKGAAKDKLNPHFKQKYADLASVWDACREPLAVNGLAVLQPVMSSGKSVIVTTLLVHESGEFIRSRLEVPVAQATAQGMGSAITYGRRYALSSLVGVAADEDDDGNAASGRADGGGHGHRPPPRQEPAPVQAAPQPPKESPYQRLCRVMQENSIPDKGDSGWGPKLREVMAPRTKPGQVTDADADAVISFFFPQPPDGIPHN